MRIKVESIKDGEKEFDIVNLNDIKVENVKGSFEEIRTFILLNSSVLQLKEFFEENKQEALIKLIQDNYEAEDLVKIELEGNELHVDWI